MKELSIKEKAKRLDEIIKKIMGMMPSWERLTYTGKTFLQDLTYIIPELKKSEDEKIRKALMQNLKERFGTKGNMGEGLDMPDVLAWFEKQGEQKTVNHNLEDKEETIVYQGEVYTRFYRDELDKFACKYPKKVPLSSKKYRKYSETDLIIAVKAGAKWQKEQMMAKAKSGTVQKDNQVILDNGTYIDLDPSMQLKPSFAGLKEGDRIKVIIIKED